MHYNVVFLMNLHPSSNIHYGEEEAERQNFDLCGIALKYP